MNKILVVGNSLAVIKTIEEIRKKDETSELTLVCTESLLPYDRRLLPSFVAGQIKESQIHHIPTQFFQKHKVQVISNEKIIRISLKRKHITFESKLQLAYDQMHIVDLGLLSPWLIKGHQKTGVFDCALLSSTKKMMKYVTFSDTVIVSVTNLQGFNMACALHSLGKEVIIVCPSANLLPEFLDDETASLLKQIIEGKSMRMVHSATIEEILGESEVKAVKLSTGKVFGCQMVITDHLNLDWRLVEDMTAFEKVEDDFFGFHLPILPTHFGFKVLNGFCVGMTKLPQDGREYLKFDGPDNIYKKIFAQGEVLVGAVLFNAPSHEDLLLKNITEGIAVSGQEEAMLGG